MKEQITLLAKWIFYFLIFIPLLSILGYWIGFYIYGPLIYYLFN